MAQLSGCICLQSLVPHWTKLSGTYLISGHRSSYFEENCVEQSRRNCCPKGLERFIRLQMEKLLPNLPQSMDDVQVNRSIMLHKVENRIVSIKRKELTKSRITHAIVLSNAHYNAVQHIASFILTN